jgi:autotransporter-associated beta strand protein
LPEWYGQPRSSHAGYLFSTAGTSPAANINENPFGSPVAVITLGDLADGWQQPADPIALSGVAYDGAWDLGNQGYISVTVPFAPSAPLAGMYYDVKYQVYAVAYHGITPLPVLDTPGMAVAGLTTQSGTVALDPWFPGAAWDFQQWNGSIEHLAATTLTFDLKVPPPVAPLYRGTTSVVDTYEIFTQYTWHASDPLARVWDGRDVDDNLWTSKDNWGGIAPVSGDTLYFAGTTRMEPANNMEAGTSFGGITFLSDAGAFTLGGNAITLAGNVTNLGNHLQTIQLPVNLTGEHTFSTNGTAGGITVSGVVSGATGGIIKTGDGVLNLTGANTYQGNTTVANGTLALSGAGTIAASPVIAVTAGAVLDVSDVNGGLWTLGGSQTLTGAGTVNGNTRIAGTHAPGSGIGAVVMDGDVTYAAGSIFEWQMDSSVREGTRGMDYDALDISGTLGGAGAVFRIVLGGNDTFDQEFWNTSRTWSDIFQTAGSSLAFDSIFSSLTYANALGDLAVPSATTRGTFSIPGTSLVWSAVPEPKSVLVGLLLTSLWLRRQRSPQNDMI